jgi:hypothetical protein
MEAASVGGLSQFKFDVRCLLLAHCVNSRSCLEWLLLDA